MEVELCRNKHENISRLTILWILKNPTRCEHLHILVRDNLDLFQSILLKKMSS